MDRLSIKYIVVATLTLLIANEICFSEDVECFRQLNPHRGEVITKMRGRLINIKLDGTAKGGELVLLEMMPNPQPRYIRIDTRAGESAETVLTRMAAAFNEFNPFNPHQKWNIRAEGKFLKTFPGGPADYVFAGTETGLGIPPPPTSLSASYDAQRQEVSLHWENPAEMYDAIGGIVGGIHAGTATSAVFKCPPPDKRRIQPPMIWHEDTRANKGLCRFYVIGCRGGVLSNAAVITLGYEDNSQQELDTQPFTAGICPNWKAWSHGGEPGMLVLEQGTKGEWKRFERFDRRSGSAIEPKDKHYFQRIKTRLPSVTGGVYRKFLGLQPGHTYRVYTRMNTFEMDGVQQNWSFSFHAVPHAKAVTLSSKQMAGTAPLPDGSAGSPAGQVASYGPGSTTKGQFVERSTEKSGPNSQVLDITLPPGAEVITVWFRYSGPPSGGVGFDWVKVKDITTGGS